MPHTLHPHPALAAPLWQISVEVTRSDAGLLLMYCITGDLAQLRLPEVVADPGFSDGLWQHTCLEAFIGQRGATIYREYNFAPNGAWAVYDFSDCRQRADVPRPAWAPALAFSRQSEHYCLTAHLPADLLPPDPAELGLTAVLEAQDGSLSYFALHHPVARPDFHDRRGWLERVPD